MKNQFFAVYNKKGVLVSISKYKKIAQQEALKKSNHRWTHQTFWNYLVKDGYTVFKSKIVKY